MNKYFRIELFDLCLLRIFMCITHTPTLVFDTEGVLRIFGSQTSGYLKKNISQPHQNFTLNKFIDIQNLATSS